MARGRELLSPGTRQYATKTRYSSDTLQQALNHIEIGKIGHWETARLYSIPRQTLVNKLKINTVTILRSLIFFHSWKRKYLWNTMCF